MTQVSALFFLFHMHAWHQWLSRAVVYQAKSGVQFYASWILFRDLSIENERNHVTESWCIYISQSLLTVRE